VDRSQTVAWSRSTGFLIAGLERIAPLQLGPYQHTELTLGHLRMAPSLSHHRLRQKSGDSSIVLLPCAPRGYMRVRPGASRIRCSSHFLACPTALSPAGAHPHIRSTHGHNDAVRTHDCHERVRRAHGRYPMKSDVVRGDYERARGSPFVRAIASWLRRSDNALLAFERCAAGYTRRPQRDGGLREVPIDQIVGAWPVPRFRPRVPPAPGEDERSVGERRPRSSRAGPKFLRSSSTGSARCTSSRNGNHRVSVARERGQAFIDAHVIDVVTPAPVESAEDLLDFIRDRDRSGSTKTTDLLRLRPGARIELTLPASTTSSSSTSRPIAGISATSRSARSVTPRPSPAGTTRLPTDGRGDPQDRSAA